MLLAFLLCYYPHTKAPEFDKDFLSLTKLLEVESN